MTWIALMLIVVGVQALSAWRWGLSGGSPVAGFVIGLIAAGIAWTVWYRAGEPMWRLGRMYGWRTGWRFYRFVNREAGAEVERIGKHWRPGDAEPSGIDELRKRLPKRRH